MNNPIFQSFRNFNLYFFFWIILSLIDLLLFTVFIRIDFITALADSFIFNLLLCGMGLSFWYSARYMPFEKFELVKIFLKHVFGGIIASAIWLAAGFYILKAILSEDVHFENFFMETLPWRIVIGILFYFLITSFYYIVIYYTGFRERIVAESELKNLVTAAELKSLKFQINPHFIFNSLNSMSALTMIDAEKAKSMILKLADFLRYTLANNEKQQNKLSEELKNLRLYLDIEKIRFEDKFEFVEEVSPECKDVPVPNMILQPLFENAIKHAVYETLDKVTLKLVCKKENDFTKIILENNFDSSDSASKGTGTGLKNINSRLHLIYGQKNLMEIKKDKNIFQVILFIPCSN